MPPKWATCPSSIRMDRSAMAVGHTGNLTNPRVTEVKRGCMVRTESEAAVEAPVVHEDDADGCDDDYHWLDSCSMQEGVM